MTTESRARPRTRTATLVLVSADGAVRGQVGPVELPEPWWQETAPITDIVPGAHVLRLLDAEPDDGEVMGGTVSYLVGHDGPIPEPLSLRPWDGSLDDHPKRLPWARPGGPSADLAWVASTVTVDPGRLAPAASHVESVGDLVDPRHRRRTESGPRHRLAQVRATVLLSRSGHPRSAVRPARSPTNRRRPPPAPSRTDAGLRQLRTRSPRGAGHGGLARRICNGLRPIGSDRLLSAGVPDLRAGALVDELTSLVHRVAPDDKLLTDFVDSLPSRMDRVAMLGLPDVFWATAIHTDGNSRRGNRPGSVVRLG